MKKTEDLFKELTDKYGPEMMAELSVYIQKEIPFKNEDFAFWNEMANKEFKELILKYNSANKIIEEYKTLLDSNKEIGEIEINYLKALSDLEKSEATNKILTFFENFLCHSEILSNIDKEYKNLPKPIKDLLDDFDFRNSNEKMVTAIHFLSERIFDNIKNQEENDKAKHEYEDRKVLERLLNDNSTYYDEEKKIVCSVCENSPCICSDPQHNE